MVTLPKSLADQIKKEHSLMFGALAGIKAKTSLFEVCADSYEIVEDVRKIADDVIKAVTK